MRPNLNLRINLELLQASMLLLVKCYDNKMVKLPYNLNIVHLFKPKVANQQQQNKYCKRTAAVGNKVWQYYPLDSKL